MNQETNEMKEYLEKKGKTAGRVQKADRSKSSALSRLRNRGVAVVGLFKKYGYKILKTVLFVGFLYKVEFAFSKMRGHVAKNGGFKKQGYGQYQPY
mmetsp:Transcript_34207/g.35501  ORF Transcript_34207/g.35501 Transcript_34207/m.35501 type:complete len:96 (+) Transcript_34207:37-324(+)